jgi:hypothetical protein
MLSILSTTANSNEIKWMQNKTQAKKHNFPINCPKTGANPNQAECHPDPEQAKRAGRGIACPELVEWTSAFDLPKQLRVPWGEPHRPSQPAPFESNTNPQPQPNQIHPSKTPLSSLSTRVNPNDFKWMQNTTQAKNHNFPIHCPKTSANPSLALRSMPAGLSLAVGSKFARISLAIPCLSVPCTLYPVPCF